MAEAATVVADQAAASENLGFITRIDGASGLQDPDDREAQEARAALAAEEAGAATPGQGEGEAQPAQQPAPAATPPAAPAGQQPDKPAAEQGPVPYARFREVNQQARQLADQLREERERSAFLEGVATAHAARGQPANGQPAPPPDPQQQLTERLTAARASLRASADKLDKGEITAAQHVDAQIAYDEERDAIAAERAKLAQQATASPAKPTSPSYALSDEAVLNEQAVKLEADHPYLVHLTPNHFAALKNKAYALAEAEGIEIGTGPRADMTLRGLVGRLSDTWGPKWLPNVQVQPKQPQAPASTAGQQPQLSPTAKARQDKLGLAAAHAPDTATLGAAGSGEGAGIPTDAQLESMTDEEIAALPRTVRDRLILQ